jgi:hypothetical protein
MVSGLTDQEVLSELDRLRQHRPACGFGFRIQALEVRDYGIEFKVYGFRILVLRFRIFGFWFQVLGFRVSVSGFRVQKFGIVDSTDLLMLYVSGVRL